MKVMISISDLEALGKDFEECKKKTYGKQTVAVYRAMRPFIELLDDYRRATQAYIVEHAEEGETGIRRYESMTDQDGNELDQEAKRRLGVAETEEFKEFNRFNLDLVSEIHDFDITPVLEEKEAGKLNMNSLWVMDRLGILVNPAEKVDSREAEGDEEDV